jgi:hypothetical protein
LPEAAAASEAVSLADDDAESISLQRRRQDNRLQI